MSEIPANNTNGALGGSMVHAKVPLPKFVGHPSHPLKHKGNHARLLQYLQQRLSAGKDARDNELPRWVRVDKNFAGWMKLSEEDKRRDRTKESEGIAQAVEMNLPLAFVHIDDMMTYFAQTFAPNRGMFYHSGKPDEVGEAQGIVTKMNNDALYTSLFRETLMGICSLLKYNRGGFEVNWGSEQGPKIVETEQGARVDLQTRWQGNRAEAIDLYNFMPDPTVHPTRLHLDGEFAALAKMKSYFWLQNKASLGVYHNCENALANHTGSTDCTYYRSPPAEANFTAGHAGGSGTNWVSILSERSGYEAVGTFELVEITIRLNPTEFGLIAGSAAERSARNQYEVWRFTILNDEYIIQATHLNNIHGYLPFFMGLINDDLMGSAQKSVTEILTPLQDFASFLMNVHVKGSRSALYGTTFYDPSVVDMRSIPKGEVAVRVPIKPAGWGKDIRLAVQHDRANVDTKQTLGDLEAIMGVINQFFPTQAMPSQIASIDRAVDSQVAAVQQGTNRRQQKAARLLDDSLFRNVRFCMYYNILQYQPSSESEIQDYYTGKSVSIDLAKLRETDLPFIIGQGLKAIDRQAAASSLQQVIFALIQAPQAAAGLDLLSLIDYWTSMIDIDVDMKQFRIAPPPQPGAPPGADPAAEAAGGAAIQPATDPQNLTQPIFG